MQSGILLLDKPRGITSNAALGRAKRVLNIRKAGHTGALDPLATGLLPLCFGQATKVSGLLLDADKSYVADIELGSETDSGDAEGTVVERHEVPGISADRVESVLARFRGEIDQVPPMYSALKHQGRRLHELARAGIEVERKPRRVTIHDLELLDRGPSRLTLRVRCSKGTYIRSLAVDIGRVLECGAHLAALRRDASGPFSLREAIALDDLEIMSEEDARARLLPPDRALLDWPRIDLDADAADEIRHGRTVPTDCPPSEGIRMYTGNRFLGLGRLDEGGVLRVRRLFK